MQLSLTLPVPTSLNELYINEYSWNPKKKMRTPTGRRILSKDGEKCKAELIKLTTEQLQDQQWDYEYTLDNYIYMDTVIYFSRKGRDDNNIYKLLCDSLEKLVYENDSRVLIRTQKILYDTTNPHIEVTLKPVEYKGIFNNEIHMNQFEDKCKKCKRYKRNCSILNKAKEGRIQEEINEEFVCAKYSEKK
ncbi:RusA family crossover junction endodeoxyribonuclease [uncultured Metabacillus sp.]|uniref:RusA family crossover junction endodeoxyribonuclease n=1 Tax=uncultured Metabacillus sp. TaxID=2860135 RepID=UPI00262E4DD7|nr:RusA family crossover junction endodeoxyribonuclease [uncultured Metabacillus sp.]